MLSIKRLFVALSVIFASVSTALANGQCPGFDLETTASGAVWSLGKTCVFNQGAVSITLAKKDEFQVEIQADIAAETVYENLVSLRRQGSLEISFSGVCRGKCARYIPMIAERLHFQKGALVLHDEPSLDTDLNIFRPHFDGFLDGVPFGREEIKEFNADWEEKVKSHLEGPLRIAVHTRTHPDHLTFPAQVSRRMFRTMPVQCGSRHPGVILTQEYFEEFGVKTSGQLALHIPFSDLIKVTEQDGSLTSLTFGFEAGPFWSKELGRDAYQVCWPRLPE